MLKIKLTILCGLFIQFAFAQDYQPLLVDNAHWKMCWSLTEEIWDCGRMSEYQLRGDTTIEGQVYARLYSRTFLNNGEPGGELSSHDTPFRVVAEELIGYLREDTENRKVYLLTTEHYTCGDTSPGEEVLLYDFDLEVGDTLQGCLLSIFPDDPLVVTSITMEEWYGQDRRTFHLEDMFGTSIFMLVEGLGFSAGLLTEPYLNVSGGSADLWDYCVGNDMDCNVNTPEMLVNPYQEWHLREFVYGFTGSSVSITYEYRFGDTSSWNGHTYFGLEKRQLVAQPDWESTNFLFRQDGQKVYRITSSPTPAEELIYDFSISQIGSTMPGLQNWALDGMFLHGIDSVTLATGVRRKRLIWQDPIYPFLKYNWIEGIGANDHPFTPDQAFSNEVDGLGIKTQCFYLANDLENPVWMNPDEPTCYIYSVDTEEENLSNRKIYPNPFRNELFLEGAESGDYLQWRNASGQQLGISTITGNAVDNPAFLTQLPSGLYFYEWYDEGGRLLQSGKLVK